MIVAIIQARLSSTRLWHKVARRIAGKSMLEWVIIRVRQIPSIFQVVVATSTEARDQWVAVTSRNLGVVCIRGPLHDVLARYDWAAHELCLRPNDLIVRVTSDCPALDPEVSEQVIQYHLAHRVDYTANLRDWPDGLDTEIFTRQALREAVHMTGNPEDREHVTPWMRRNLFCLELPHEPNLRHMKFSVDTEEELEYVRELYAGLGPDFRWGEVLTVDPKRVCGLCQDGVPHVRRGDVIMWDLHSTRPDWSECQAWAIHQRAVETPRLTIGAPSGGGAPPKSPSGDPVSRSDVASR